MTRGKLRRRLRERFVELNKELLLKAINEKKQRKSFSLKLSYTEQLIADKMRKLIGYSCKTNDFDMVHSIIRLAKEMFAE